MAAPTLIFDFDSTLVRIETLEALADIALAGHPEADAIRAEVASLTERAMAGDVAFGEALRPEFRAYAAQVVENARAMAAVLAERGSAIVSGGTDSHLMLVDLRPKRLTGKAAEASLERAGITCNKNGVPFDPEKPTLTSGVRLGTPAGTTRGFGVAEFRLVGELIDEVLNALSRNPDGDAQVERAVREKVRALCARFPIYQAA